MRRAVVGDDTLILVIAREITERKESEQTLELFEMLVDQSNDELYVVDAATGEILRVNRTVCDDLQYSRDDLVGESVTNVSARFDDIDAWQAHVDELRADDAFRAETTHVRADGTTYPVEVSVSYVDLDTGSYVITIARDITERNTQERELQERRAHLQQAQEIADLGSWRVDIPDDEIEWSEEVYRIFGGDEAESLTFDECLRYVHPDDRADVEDQWTAALDGDPYDVEHRIVVDGETKWVHERAQIRFDEDGDPTEGIGVIQDVTEHKHHEQTLERLHTTTRDLLAATTTEEVATITSDTATAVLDLPFNGVHLYDAAANAFVPVAWSGPEEAVLDGPPPSIPAGEGLAWEAYVTDEPTSYADVRETTDVLDADTPFRSELHLPLGEHGVLIVGSTTTDDFDATDEALAWVLAANVEAALDRLGQEQTLDEEREKYATLVEESHDAIAIHQDGRFVFANEPCLEMLGYEEDELLDIPFERITAPEDREYVRELYERRLDPDAEQPPRQYETQFLTNDGEQRVGEISAAQVQYEGRPAVLVTVRDVTERKRKEQELERYRARLSLALEVANAGVWEHDLETDEEMWDDTVERLFGLEPGDFEGSVEGFLSRVHPADRSAVEAATRRAVEERESYEMEFRIRPEDETGIHWLASRGEVLTDGSGDPVKMEGITIDVTELKESQAQLAQRSEELEALNRVVRHDIRNDMEVILGWAQMLDDHVDEQGEKYLRQILASGEHIVELTDSARDYIETLTSPDEITVMPTPLRSVLETELDLRRESFPEAEFTLTGEIPDVSVQANEMLGSVFRNLLNNAVQHNHKADPVVTVSCQETEADVLVRIADNGPGIPDERKESIFGKGDKGVESEGTGIGLYLVQTLVTQYDGTVWVEDNDPEGTVFNVRLSKAA